jgi:hypothetical protein
VNLTLKLITLIEKGAQRIRLRLGNNIRKAILLEVIFIDLSPILIQIILEIYASARASFICNFQDSLVNLL